MKTAKLFINGQSQAIRLPKAFRLKGSEVFIKKLGNAIVLIPFESDPWKAFFKNLKRFSDDFMPSREQPPPQIRETFF